MNLETRARSHAALGDQRRLLIVDELVAGDLTASELAERVGMRGNLLAHHLEVLEEADLIERRQSEGDRRRRYVALRREGLPDPIGRYRLSATRIAFVCTHNSARSQFAAALWRQLSDSEVWSAGTHPAERVHPKAVRVAAEFGLDLSDAVPSGYESLPSDPDVVVSVCDRARESEVPKAQELHHWSIADPVSIGTLDAFRSTFAQIENRIKRLAITPEEAQCA